MKKKNKTLRCHNNNDIGKVYESENSGRSTRLDC